MRNPSFDKYFKYTEITEILKQYAAEYPHIMKLESIGKSYEGRDIWVAKVTNWDTGPDIEKPAYYVDAGIHSFEVSTANTALNVLHYLMENYGKDEMVTDCLDTRAIYILPRVNPDGAELTLADHPKLVRGVTRPYPDDQDPESGLFEEDIDGDGRLLYMRIKDPNGNWKKHPDYPQLMIPRDPVEHGGEYYRILPEGTIHNWDGETIDVVSLYGLIDWPYGKWRKERIDMNKNFPRHWTKTVKPGTSSGPYPTSESETRAVVEFIVNHPNIGGNLLFHTIGRMAYRPYDDRSVDEMYEEDLRMYKEIGDKGTEFTGYYHIDEYVGFKSLAGVGYPGNSMMWAYDQQGIISWLIELWQPVVSSGILDGSKYLHYEWFKKHPLEQDIALYKWAKDNFGNESYVDWYEFDHPQLGKVELGGWDWLFTWLNPPIKCLEDEVKGFPKWVVWNTLISPKLAVRNTSVESLGGDNYRVRLVVENTGYLPSYVTKQAVKMGCKGVTVDIELPDGANMVSGTYRTELGQLEGRAYKDAMVSARQGATDDRAMAEWIIYAPKGGRVHIKAAHPRAGVVRETLELK